MRLFKSYDVQFNINDCKDIYLDYHSFDSLEFQELLDKFWGVSLITPDRACIIYQFAKQFKDYPAAEVGVYKGGSARLISKVNKDKVYLFDTFEGLPSVNENDIHHATDMNEINLFEQVKEYLKDCLNAKIFKGVFPETARDIWNIFDFGFVHLDGDTYQTTLDGLRFFYPRLITGGVILLDDYDCVTTPGCKIACDEFLRDKKEIIIGLGNLQGLLIKL